jgi:DNA-binding NarL/FixJ family response regulator
MLITPPTPPDLAIIDLSLPDGNGLDLIKRLIARFPDFLILISSMHDETMFAERALKAGAKGYINKQASGDDLIDAIKQILNGKIYFSPHVLEHFLQKNSSHDQLQEQHPIQKLSDRELEVFEYIGQGLGTGEIAKRLNLSIKTVESHRANIKRKLGLASAGELTRRAIQWSLEPN